MWEMLFGYPLFYDEDTSKTKMKIIRYAEKQVFHLIS